MFRMTVSTVAPLLLLAACAPQSAVLTAGDYVAFISADTSTSLAKGELRIEAFDKKTLYNIDCRTFDTLTKEEADTMRLENPLDICPVPVALGGAKDQDPEDGFHDTKNNMWPGENPLAPDHEEWIFQGPFHAVTEQLEPWRGEAVITAEGDLQIGFHHRLPGGADFRFAFAIDPDFAPTTCVQDGDKVTAEPIDGDWLDGWSGELERYANPSDYWTEDQFETKKDYEDFMASLESSFSHLDNHIDGGRLWLLNASGYQFNPGDTDDYWFFPREFAAGTAAGKFAEERFSVRGPRYAEPLFYNLLDAESAYGTSVPSEEVWHCDMEPDADPSIVPEDCAECVGNGDGFNTFCDLVDRVEVVEYEIYQELQIINPNENEVLALQPLTIRNDWRIPDGRDPGLDGWVGMHYNYVVLDEKSNIEVGGNVSGAFTLVFDADDTKSRFFVQGEFEVEKIRKDRWTTPDLHAIKLEESPDVKNESSLCVGK